MMTPEEAVAQLTPEQAIAELMKDKKYIMQLSWSFLLGIAANHFFMTGTPPAEIHAMADIALVSGVLDESLPPWVFLLALAATRLQSIVETSEVIHQAIDMGLQQVAGGGQA